MKVADLLALQLRPELEEAHAWAVSFDDAIDEWWRQCPHGNAMLEVAALLELPPSLQIFAACQCVDTISDLIPPGLKPQTDKALQTCRSYSLGKASLASVRRVMKDVQDRARATKLSPSEASAVAAVATLLTHGAEATVRFTADTRAIALNPESLYGNYDTPGFKRAYEAANETCAHAIRAVIPPEIVLAFFEQTAEA